MNTISPLLVQRIYRLALTATGNHRFAQTTSIQLFSQTNFASHDLETAVLVQLFAQLAKLDRNTWKLRKPAQSQPNKQANQQLESMFKVLRKASPQARFMLALYSLWGMQANEIRRVLGVTLDEFHTLRVDLALASGLVSSENERSQLERLARFILNELGETEQMAQRAELLNSAHARSLRHALIANDEQLSKVLTAIFDDATPPDLLAQIEQAKQEPIAKRQLGRGLLFNLVVVLIVGGLIGLLLVWPETHSEAKSERPVGNNAPTIDLRSMIEASLRRFETPVIDQGLLHERYNITIENNTWQIERWYDFDNPQRFAFTLQANQEPGEFYTVKGDGNGGLEINSLQGRLGVELKPELLAQISPILMQQPNPYIAQFSQTPALEQFFLKQALENHAYSLGTSRFLSRPVTIIAYTSRYFLHHGIVHPDWDYDHAQVLLTLDNQTFSLLQAQVLLDGQAGSTIITPWRAEHLSFNDQADPELFTITGERNDELLSPRIVFGDYAQQSKSLSLRSALERSNTTIYLPRTLIDESLWARMLYQEEAEGEVFSVLIEDGQRLSILTTLPRAWSEPKADVEIKQVGSFSYTTTVRESLTQVDLLDQSTGQNFGLVIFDNLTPRNEIEKQIEEIVASLEPLTLDNIDQFQPRFIKP